MFLCTVAFHIYHILSVQVDILNMLILSHACWLSLQVLLIKAHPLLAVYFPLYIAVPFNMGNTDAEGKVILLN